MTEDQIDTLKILYKYAIIKGYVSKQTYDTRICHYKQGKLIKPTGIFAVAFDIVELIKNGITRNNFVDFFALVDELKSINKK